MTKQRRIHDRHALKPQDWKGRYGRTIFFFFIAATRSWGQEMAARKIWGRPFWNHLLKYVTDLDFG